MPILLAKCGWIMLNPFRWWKSLLDGETNGNQKAGSTVWCPTGSALEDGIATSCDLLSPNVAVTEDEKNQRNWAKLVKFYLFKPFLKMCLNNSNSIVSCVKVWGKYQKSIEKRFWLLKTSNPGILWSGSVQLYKVQWLTVRGWTIQAICEGSNFQTSVHPHNGDLRHGSYHENMISFIAKTIEPILSIDLFGIYWNDLSSLQDPKCPQKNPG